MLTLLLLFVAVAVWCCYCWCCYCCFSCRCCCVPQPNILRVTRFTEVYNDKCITYVLEGGMCDVVVVVVVVVTQPHGVPHIVFGFNIDLHFWRVDALI